MAMVYTLRKFFLKIGQTFASLCKLVLILKTQKKRYTQYTCMSGPVPSENHGLILRLQQLLRINSAHNIQKYLERTLDFLDWTALCKVRPSSYVELFMRRA